jgi:hypothetical protein
MSQFLGFGNGSDGVLTISSNTTDSPIDSGCSGSSGSTSLSATNTQFAARQIILIHQSRGSNAGAWEINQIASYSAGNIITTSSLTNTYVDSGADQAQVLVLKQYSSVNINSGITLTCKAWDGTVGGILAFLANGTVTVTGTITAKGQGYQGSSGPSINGQYAYIGEGTTQSVNSVQSRNGAGGGGGGSFACDASGQYFGGGGGGSHATVGTNGNDNPNGCAPVGGYGATTILGVADLTTMTFGGGGAGSSGGGIIFITGATITITGTVNANGVDGGNGNTFYPGGGGGAGGSVLIKAQVATLGTSLITTIGGVGGTNGVQSGGNGGTGRIRVEACSLSGTTNPAASSQTGGFNFCGSATAIIG